MTVGNIYVIAAVAVVGGGLFGFDISSVSFHSVTVRSWQGQTYLEGSSLITHFSDVSPEYIMCFGSKLISQRSIDVGYYLDESVSLLLQPRTAVFQH